MNRQLSLGLTALMVTLVSTTTRAQEVLPHEATYYTAPEGKLFWNAELPIYIFISTDSTGTDGQRLKSENPSHGNPMFLDTEGINWIRSQWAVNQQTHQPISPQQEILFPVWRDGTAPKTKVSFTQAQRAQTPERLYYGPNLRLSTAATDGGAGVAATYISVDAQPYTRYTDTLRLTTDARHVIKVYSVDHVGNVEAPQEFLFEVDVTAPLTRHTIGGEYNRDILSVRASITLESTDQSSGVQQVYYQLDGGTARKYGSSIPFQGLPDGEHVLTYYTVDRVGNREADKQFSFYLDKTPPVVTATVIGDQYQNRGRVFISDRTTVELKAEDNHSGVKSMVFSIDGGVEKEYTEPFPLKKSDGNHVVNYYAVDAVGNGFRGEFKEEYGGRQALSLDMEAPEVKYSFAGDLYITRDTAFITSKTEIGLEASDEDSGVKNIGYKINGGAGQVYEAPFTIPEEGFYSVDFFSTDLVNNRNTAEFFFIVDNTGPEIERIFSAEPVGRIELDDKDTALPVYSKGLTVYLGATDHRVNTKEIWYSLNGGQAVLYTRPIKVNQLGINTISVTATDELGNKTELEAVEFFVK